MRPPMTPSFDLRVAPIDRVIPHEEVEDGRVERLVTRLAADGLLVNPPLAATTEDAFVVLDGATRVAALGRLGCSHVVVQAVDAASLRLETWCHVVRGIDPDELASILERVPGAHLRTGPHHGLFRVHLTDGRVLVAEAWEDADPFAVIGDLVAAYQVRGPIARTLDPNPRAARAEHPDFTALEVFPRLDLDQVVDAARSGRRLPAGITRFIASGRVLRLDAELSMLRPGLEDAERDRWLAELVAARRARGAVRYYPESVFVLDE